MRILLVVVCLFCTAASAAERDFLTTAEVDQLRETQEPNARLLLYLGFAKERVALVQQLAARQRGGRGAMIHEALDQYIKIIDAIDTVTDDALRRRVPVDKGMSETVAAEKQMLESLKKFSASEPQDVSAYQFMLEQAISATQDSMDLAGEDLKIRSSEVDAKDAKEQKEREALMRSEEVEAKRGAEKKEAEQKKKAPTLRRPGEVVKDKP